MQAAWGKLQPTGSGSFARLPLSSHCLDVASVFRALIEVPIVSARLAKASGRPLTDIDKDRLAVIALLHDLGKANLGFQNKPFFPAAPKAGHIRELELLFVDPALTDKLEEALELDTLLLWVESEEALEKLLCASWSHHGLPVQFKGDRTGIDPAWWKASLEMDPFATVADLIKTAKNEFPRAFSSDGPPLPGSAALQHRFAGLVMLADWLGSHQLAFPIVRDTEFSARSAASQVLISVGLDTNRYRQQVARKHLSFEDLFAFSPRPLQAAIDNWGAQESDDRLLIAEAETGSGKTEAALARFFRLFASGTVEGLYFALPTRVAARELYDRVEAYIRKAFPEPASRPSTVLAVPGYAQLDGLDVSRILPEESPWAEKELSTRWAAEHPKRFLAATIAVGTIDQALLSTLQSRHAHLRSVCLDRSLLVVDEVHASDPYMRRLLSSLLSHHCGLGGQALLLSATLGSRASQEFIAAVGGRPRSVNLDTATSLPYPAVTNLTAAPVGTGRDGAKEKQVTVTMHPCFGNPDAIKPEIIAAVQAGARVLVVMNTVARAIAMQRDLESDNSIDPNALFSCNGVVCPHHGRFAPSDRAILDKAVSRRLGKASPQGAVVLVGTQTLEQSLDIDADLLISDLCPSDVLLQRIGRLHRHVRSRPQGYEGARCLLIVPDQGNLETLLDHSGDANGWAKARGLGSVYPDLRALELTRRMLEATPVISIPSDNRRLVEGTTHPEALGTLSGPKWDAHAQRLEGKVLAQELAAHLAVIQYDKPLGETHFTDVLRNSAARTRLGVDALRLPLARPVKGPFGRPVSEIQIPGRWLPAGASGELPNVLDSLDGVIHLAIGGVRFSYSRLGMESNADKPTK